ncbi:hypothetical protein SUGI_0572980 [Cryptomeria japonica]|nr:hypothetical protein SUGI_0572980 [Cryptomeria japonica]
MLEQHHLSTEILRGTSIFKGDGKLQGPFPLVYVSASNSSKRCLDGSLDPNVVKGKIVLWDKLLYVSNGGADEVARAGGAGVILANGELLGAEQLLTSPNSLPAISVSFSAGEKIKSYINSRLNNVTATMRLPGLIIVGNATPAPTVASFSSRGPSEAYPSVLKPDIVAPGRFILAAGVGGAAIYELRSGTSMACPHISGIAALIKAIHPTWSPAAIRSALMTFSYTVDNQGKAIKDSVTMEAADSFDMGAGHVDPRAALDPGLVYNMAPQDYIDFLCSLNYTRRQISLLTKDPVSCPKSNLEAADLNYPSFSIVFKPGNNSIKSPPGVNISVEPQTLVFKKLYDKASYSVKFESNRRSPSASEGNQDDFGEIRWTCIDGGIQVVRSPVAFTWQSSN